MRDPLRLAEDALKNAPHCTATSRSRFRGTRGIRRGSLPLSPRCCVGLPPGVGVLVEGEADAACMTEAARDDVGSVDLNRRLRALGYRRG
jgi:hypothetical protein